MALAWGLGALAGCGDDGGGSGSTGASSGSSTAASQGSSTAVADEGSSSGSLAEPGPCAEPIPAHEPPTAALSIDADGRLVDALGRGVIMRGLNTGGRSKFDPFLPFDVADPDDLEAVRAEADAYFERMVGWGLDTARMPLSWEALEPTPGVYDAAYVARVRALLDAAWARRIRVVLDFHQDVYASPFCGDGFPPWSIPTPDPPAPTHECEGWFLGYFTNADLRESFDRFWSDADGLQGPFLAMWLHLVDEVGDHPAVVGLEPMNEPGWGSAEDLEAFKLDVLRPWYATIAAELRAAAPGAIVFYDGLGTDSSGGIPTHIRPEGEGLAYAPHLYDPSLLLGDAWGGDDPTPVIASMAEFGAEAGVPVLLGEFGVTHGAKDAGAWVTLVVDALDEHRVSATMWEYSTSAELWNFEDLSVTEADGSERAVLDAYVRPWVRALAGQGLSTTWDGAAAVLDASWTAGEGFTEVVVPSRIFGAEPRAIELGGPGACYTWDPGRSELRVMAPAGTAVSLELR